MGAKNICWWSVPLQPQRVKKKLNNLRVACVTEVISWKILWYTQWVITCKASEKRRLWSSMTAIVHGKLCHSDCQPKQISDSLLRAVVQNARAEWITEAEVCQRIFTETNYEVLRLLFSVTKTIWHSSCGAQHHKIPQLRNGKREVFDRSDTSCKKMRTSSCEPPHVVIMYTLYLLIHLVMDTGSRPRLGAEKPANKVSARQFQGAHHLGIRTLHDITKGSLPELCGLARIF